MTIEICQTQSQLNQNGVDELKEQVNKFFEHNAKATFVSVDFSVTPLPNGHFMYTAFIVYKGTAASKRAK